MRTAEIITALHDAAARGDLDATSELLFRLELRIAPEEMLDLCAKLPLPLAPPTCATPSLLTRPPQVLCR